MNGYVKDGAHGALADPTRRRIRGRAAQSVFGAFILFAENIRKIVAYVAQEEAIETWSGNWMRFSAPTPSGWPRPD
jgi:hypothetical protein